MLFSAPVAFSLTILIVICLGVASLQHIDTVNAPMAPGYAKKDDNVEFFEFQNLDVHCRASQYISLRSFHYSGGC